MVLDIELTSKLRLREFTTNVVPVVLSRSWFVTRRVVTQCNSDCACFPFNGRLGCFQESMGDDPTLNNFYFSCEAKEVEEHLGSFSSSLDKNITCNDADSIVEILVEVG